MADLQGLENVDYIEVPTKLEQMMDQKAVFSGNYFPDTRKYIKVVEEVRPNLQMILL